MRVCPGAGGRDPGWGWGRQERGVGWVYNDFTLT